MADENAACSLVRKRSSVNAHRRIEVRADRRRNFGAYGTDRSNNLLCTAESSEAPEDSGRSALAVGGQ